MEKSWFDTQFALARKAGKKRDYKKAIAILEDLAARGMGDSSAGGNPEVYLYLSRAWHAEKMYSRAAVCARSFLAECPKSGAGWFFLGRTLFSDGIFDRAAHAFQKSISFNPESVDARTLLGMTLLRSRKTALAKAVFEEALALAPDDARLNQGYLNALFVEAVHTYKKGDAESARQMLTFLINNDIDGVVPRLYLAHALRDLEYLPEALSQYEAAIQFAPEDEALRWYPVSILLEMGDTEKAAELMAALGQEPAAGAMSDRMVKLLIIKNHLEQEEWANAAQAARSCIQTYGSDAQVHALMGEAQRNLGNREKSLNHFKRALELDRENPSPHYGIMMLFLADHDWKALLGELARAERAKCDADIIAYYRVLCEANLDADPATLLPAIQELVHEHGAVSELVVALARTYFRLGFADLATGWYRKAIEIEEDNEEAYLGYIACCEETEADSGGDSAGTGKTAGKGKQGVALSGAYRSYLARWEDNADIRGDFIRYLVEREQWEEAADQSEILSGQNPAAVSDRQLALYRRKAGQYRKAAILYRKLLRAKPDDRLYLANLVLCLDRMGESESALRLIRGANHLIKSDADSMLIEGYLCMRTGDDEAALTVLRKVIDRFPNDVRGWEQIAAIYTKRGVTGMAATYAQKARDLGSQKAAPVKSRPGRSR